ncbi:MAG: molecular chaperone HtpG, partial [Acholeplasmataceae bacterium]
KKEIFLRELISNASDAIDKRHFMSLTNDKIPKADFEIWLEVDKENRTLTIKDNGIGFTEDELIESLGTIAQSGSQAFLEKLEQQDAVGLIGQFGVGFYSAFMVSKSVTVRTRSPLSDQGYEWISDGVESYTIKPLDKKEIGTDIILYLNDDIEDEDDKEDFSQYLEGYRLRSLVKTYSDYVRYPIKMMVEKTKDKKTMLEAETLNQMVPLWKRMKADIKDDDLKAFYKQHFHDYEDPIKSIHTSVEGMLTYTALLFIPRHAPHDFYSEHYEKGLQLYSKGIFIQDKNKALLPDYFKFVKGLVDSSDISLNISREMMQQDRQVQKIASHLEKKIKSELESMLQHERADYVIFYDAFRHMLKYGIYEQYGMNKDKLIDLIMFKTSKSDDYLTLKEYIDRKPESQKAIYYATGKNKQAVMNLPQMDTMKEQDLEVLLFTDDVDEFMVQMIGQYQELPFKSVQQGELDVVDEDIKKEVKSKEKEHKDLLKTLKKALKDQVKDVRLSSRLKNSAVCLVSGEGMSLEMEKVLKQMPNATDVKAERILEINPGHDLFKALVHVHAQKADQMDAYAEVLYHQALLIEGLPIDDPVVFTNRLTELMIEASHLKK